MLSNTLETERLVKVYNGRPVVNDISFKVHSGEIVALLGPNGAGKTTSFDIVVGLVRPNSGRVYLAGEDITQMRIHERSFRGIGYLTQEPSAFRQLSCFDNLKLVLEVKNYDPKHHKEKINTTLQEFGIYHLANTPAISLSGGERRRLEIARALVTDPKFILLDEPFTGIDPIAISDIQTLIHDLCKRKNIGLLITDHNPAATLSITDRAYIVQDGKIIREGTSREIADDAMVRKHYLGEKFVLV